MGRKPKIFLDQFNSLYYEQHLPFEEICHLIGVSSSSLTKFRRVHKLPLRRRIAWNFKGGRYVTFSGYVMLKCDRPSAYRGYMLEHRYVMEKHLGRLLTKSEVVHHKNEIKTDNRIENLEITNPSDHAIHHTEGKPFGINTKPRTSKYPRWFVCGICGIKFYKNVSKIRRFCSWKCSTVYRARIIRKNPAIFTCKQCGKQFPNYARKKWMDTCSRSCAGKFFNKIKVVRHTPKLSVPTRLP